MEDQSSIFAIAFVLFLLLLWVTKSYKRKSILVHKLPPGPWKLPIIGNLHQLALAGSLPHDGLHKLAKKHGPLMHLKLGEISLVVVSSPKMAKEIMKAHDLAFVDRPIFRSTKIMTYGAINIVFSPYGHYWKQMRKILVLEFLSLKRVQSFSSIREDEAAKLIDSIHSLSASPVNLTQTFYSLISTCVSREAFGANISEKDEFFSLVKKSIESGKGFDLDDLFPSLKSIGFITGLFQSKWEKLHSQIDKILEKIMNEHQEKKRRRGDLGSGEAGEENIVDVYLRLQQSGTLDIPITTTNVKAMIWDVFIGASHTSATALAWAMSEMIRNPRAMKKAQTEIREACRGNKTIHENDLDKLNYLKVIKQTMRVHPPTPLLLPRVCRESTNIDGYDIPRNTLVIVNAWAIGRDPKHWDNAESFIPERFEGSSIDFKGANFEFIPFGSGRRMCPGICFGIANIELPLAQLLYHFNWELPNGMKPEDLDMTVAFGISAGRKEDLYLIPTSYISNL